MCLLLSGSFYLMISLPLTVKCCSSRHVSNVAFSFSSLIPCRSGASGSQASVKRRMLGKASASGSAPAVSAALSESGSGSISGSLDPFDDIPRRSLISQSYLPEANVFPTLVIAAKNGIVTYVNLLTSHVSHHSPTGERPGTVIPSVPCKLSPTALQPSRRSEDRKLVAAIPLAGNGGGAVVSPSSAAELRTLLQQEEDRQARKAEGKEDSGAGVVDVRLLR